MSALATRSRGALALLIVVATCFACGGRSVTKESRAARGVGAEAGSPDQGTSGGSGGAAGRGGGDARGGQAGADTPPLVPVVRPTPAPGAAWTFRGADTLNASPPVLLPLDDDIVIAGATNDPELAGVDAFEPGITAMAFVARLDREARVLWSTPLFSSGLPSTLTLDPDGNLVIGSAYGATFFFTGAGTETTYFARLRPTGEILEEREIDFKSLMLTLAVGAEGEMYLGAADSGPGEQSHVLVTRLEADGSATWEQLWRNSGNVAVPRSMTLAPSGDIVLTGDFNATLTIGDDALVTQAQAGGYGAPNGFLARLTPAGERVFSARFGGGTLDGGTGIAALADGDLLLHGFLSGPAQVGGTDVPVTNGTSGFLARLDGDGRARWVILPGPGFADAQALDPDGVVYVAGHDDGVGWLGAYALDGREALSTPLPASGGYFFLQSLAVDSAHSLWLSGGFTDQADFGNDNVLESDGAAVFLVRLDRE